MNIDKLFESVSSKGHVCVGLDTAVEYVPPLEREKAKNDAEAVLAFNKALIESTYDVCACYKVQIAYYEEMGLEGLKAFSETLKYIRAKGCLAISDIKRGDIADTAVRYAKAHFGGDFETDFVTLNPYLGMDSIEPWLEEAEKKGKGAFILMRTSNKGSQDFQYLNLSGNENKQENSGGSHLDDCSSSRLYHKVGEKMSALAQDHLGAHGYGAFGAVIGCTQREEAALIRQKYPNLFFLIPGYGAQGGGADDVTLLLREKNGGIVNASRSIITAWKAVPGKVIDNEFAAAAARKTTVKMRDEIYGAIK